jgi:hypothetical protein
MFLGGGGHAVKHVKMHAKYTSTLTLEGTVVRTCITCFNIQKLITLHAVCTHFMIITMYDDSLTLTYWSVQLRQNFYKPYLWISGLKALFLTFIRACHLYMFLHLFSLALQPSADYGLLATRGFLITHNDAPQSVGPLWTNDKLVAETSTWQHTTDKYPCPRDLNPRSQQASGRKPTP